MREQDEVVAARLRSVFAVRGAAPPLRSPDVFADRSPLAWSDLVPSWPEDVELERAEPPRRPPDTPSSRAPIDPSAWSGVRPAWAPAGDDETAPAAPDTGRWAAFDRGRWAAFDPGRRGARALAAVAVVVVVMAAFFAWRARPRVDPVAPPPLVAVTATGGGPSAGPSAGSEVVVSVAGKVGRPGLVRLPPGARVADALTAAGGAKAGVDVAMLNPARKVVDGELILVGVTPSPGTVVAGPALPPAAGGGPGGPVNLNAATIADLDGLPGVGPVLAQRILDTRDAQGGFRAVSDLRKVDGIGDARYAQLKDLVTV